jgi:hypothetical protein
MDITPYLNRVDRDSNFQIALGAIPLVVGIWSFQWAILLGIAVLTYLVDEFMRGVKMNSVTSLALAKDKFDKDNLMVEKIKDLVEATEGMRGDLETIRIHSDYQFNRKS